MDTQNFVPMVMSIPCISTEQDVAVCAHNKKHSYIYINSEFVMLITYAIIIFMFELIISIWSCTSFTIGLVDVFQICYESSLIHW